MLFQTQTFIIIFLPLLLLAYYSLARATEWRVRILLVSSVIFYGWWDIRFVPLLLAQTIATWICAEAFFRFQNRWIAKAGIAVNLLILIAFKYSDFFATAVEGVLGGSLPRTDWLLPIGISFYTFEMVSYLLDILRGDRIRYRLSRFALFILFFPRLIAGPIVRHSEIIWQFELNPARVGASERFSKGFVLFVIGLCKKLLLADPLSRIADPLFSNAGLAVPALQESWAALIAFTLQLYFDFSAYSDMAIGVGLMLGLTLPLNFDAPYRAASLQDFWRRWHMTLSRYIRDYLYIPLGGSRRGFVRFAGATIISMSICGLWHGAGWTYVGWGAAHGLGLIAQRTWSKTGSSLPTTVSWTLTMLFVACGWVLFRSPDFTVATHMYQGLLGIGGWVSEIHPQSLGVLVASLVVATLGPTSSAYVDSHLRPTLPMALFWVLLLLYCILTVGGVSPVSFIYFQF